MTLTSLALRPARGGTSVPPRPGAWSSWTTLLISAATLAGQAIPALGGAAIAFWTLVPGLLLVRLVPSTRLPQAGLVPALSVSVTVLLATLSLWIGLWPPRLVTAAAAGLATGYAAMALTRPSLPTLALPSGRWPRITLGIGAAALVLWLI